MYLSEIRIEGFRLYGSGTDGLKLPLNPGLNILAGANDSGKSAIIDALRLVLGTSTQEFFRVQDSDFHQAGGIADSFAIRCRFDDISVTDGGGFLEHLTYQDGKPVLYINCGATRRAGSRRGIAVEFRSGREPDGPQIEAPVRQLLEATYLRPLRDADRELAAGRNSRLAQILQFVREVTETSTEVFDPARFVEAVRNQEGAALPRSVANVAKLADHLIEQNQGVTGARERLDEDYLSRLQLGGDGLASRIAVAAARDESERLRRTLEKLDLRLATADDSFAQLPHGLGYSNLLFMACELLLLGQDREKLPLLLIEEPEAHLHPQLQLRLVEFLSAQAGANAERPVQIILTTHSPNLASRAKLSSIRLLAGRRAFPLGPEHTQLSAGDYGFLERFLDVTRANLFFARGVLIVEGHSEALLLPTLANLAGVDLTEHGVSIVNVGGRGLRRYARIFRRQRDTGGTEPAQIPIRVACVADRDVRPTCAREFSRRGERFEDELPDDDARNRIIAELTGADGENVRTFVAEHWTLEYDLAYAGLGVELLQAVALAREDERRVRFPARGAIREAKLAAATATFEKLERSVAGMSDSRERVAFSVYRALIDKVSKAAAAQHLATLLAIRFKDDRNALIDRLPPYLVKAIEHATGRRVRQEAADLGPEAPGNARS